MDLEALLDIQRRQLAAATNAELRGLVPVFEQARRELASGLEGLRKSGKGDRFTAARMNDTLAQVEGTLGHLKERVQDATLDAQGLGDGLGYHHLTQQDSGFGEPRPIDVDLTRRLAREKGTLVERSRSSVERWGARSLAKTKEILAVETLKGTPINEVIDRLTAEDGPMAGQRMEAQRIVRTEMVNAYNARTQEELENYKGKRKPKKILMTPMDDRTALDSVAIVRYVDPKTGEPNIVREVGDSFWDPVRQMSFLHPPNRPNDRSSIAAYFGDSSAHQGLLKKQLERAKKLEEERGDEARRAMAKRPARRPDGRVQPERVSGKDEGGRRKDDGPRNTRKGAEEKQETRTGTDDQGPARTGAGVGTAEGAKGAESRGDLLPNRDDWNVEKVIRGPWSEKTVWQSMPALREPEIAAALEKEPLGVVEFLGRHPDRAGFYDMAERKVQVHLGISYGEIFAGGQTYAVYLGEKSKVAAIRAVITHEVAHHFWHRFPWIEEFVGEFFKGVGVAITARALDNVREYWAECFAAYFFQPKDLKDIDPKGYEMVAMVLERMRR